MEALTKNKELIANKLGRKPSNKIYNIRQDSTLTIFTYQELKKDFKKVAKKKKKSVNAYLNELMIKEVKNSKRKKPIIKSVKNKEVKKKSKLITSIFKHLRKVS